MESLLLIDKEVQERNRELLNNPIFNGRFAECDYGQRTEMYFSVVKDSKVGGADGLDVPCIHFTSEDAGRVWFHDLRHGKKHVVFTVMPHDELQKFKDKIFAFPDGGFIYGIKVSLDALRFGSYTNRLCLLEKIDFTRAAYNDGTLVRCGPEARLAHKAYLDPVQLTSISEKDFITLKNALPAESPLLILPPVYEQVEQNEKGYFNPIYRAGRQQMNVFFKAFAKLEPKVTATLAYNAWKLIDVDTPIFNDLLQEGAYFRLASSNARQPGNPNASKSYVEAGESQLVLCYATKTTEPDRYTSLSQWRTDFLFSPHAHAAADVEAIRQSVVADLTHAGADLLVKFSPAPAVQWPNYWNSIQDAHTGSSSNPDTYNDIKKFLSGQEFTSDLQHQVFRAGDEGEAFTNRGEEAFYERLWKYPFPEAEAGIPAWRRFLLQVLAPEREYKYSFSEVQKLSANQLGEWVYEENYSTETLFMLRLLLPPRAFLKARHNNVLDSNARLDTHFILS